MVQKLSVWSIDRIGRLIVGILNTLLIIVSIKISSKFLIILLIVNLNLILSSVTDKCFMRNLLKRLGAKERECFFDSKSELFDNRKLFIKEKSEAKNIELQGGLK